MQLANLARLGVVEFDDLADLGQRKPQPLATQDELEAGAVAGRLDPGLATPLGHQQALVLVEPDRPRGDVEFLGQIGDREDLGHRA